MRLVIEIDGQRYERLFAAKGLGHDGPAHGIWRLPLAAGVHRVRVELDRQGSLPPVVWQREVQAQDRTTTVLTYEPQEGFRLE